ncbi:rubredoxin [Terasakiella sp. A23]|uniref:rubredoxin n=1 Tax=Terasakiella sp. FCG-A23 TaxID=3080561 RepID=UPI00295532E2|nr:rubredoxin [Terasakiella sp. A23]MDV7339629.1 rubredoxin [Terasakiella sp. A23]
MFLVMKELSKSQAMMPLSRLGAIKEFEPQRWKCGCGSFIYDPATMGGLAFEELDKKWKCPTCGAKKKNFKKTDLKSVS